MSAFFRKLKLVWNDSNLRNRLLFVLLIFAIFRLLSSIPIPGVDAVALQSFLSGNQFFGLLNVFSGGALSQLSVLMLGVGPYITAAIIMQLMTVIFDNLKKMYHEEGEAGRKKFNHISRLITIPIAIIQGIGLLMLLQQQGVIEIIGAVPFAMNIVILVAGAMLAMWLGELITEFGIGNGVSLMIFAGIVAVVPAQISQAAFAFTPDQLLTYVGFVVAAILIVAGIVAVTEAERPVPVTYAKQSRGGQVYGGTASYIPLRVNMAGVMPLIFAISILLFPQMLANFMLASTKANIVGIGQFITDALANGWIYSSLYFLLVVAFTYFYTAITFEPETMASNLQKNGAFIPGVRPGKTTTEYIENIVTRITFAGAIFLGLIAVVPVIIQSITGNQAFAIGGTSLLIVVAVVIDLIKRIDAQVSMREY